MYKIYILYQNGKSGANLVCPRPYFLYTLFFIFPAAIQQVLFHKAFFANLQIRISHQGFIHCLCGFSSFTDCPYYQRLASVHISCCENPRYAGLISFRFCLYVSSCSCCNLKCIGHIFLASKETSCDQHQVCRDHFLRSLDRNHHHTACFGIFLTFQLYDPGLADISVFIFDKLSNGCLVNPWIMSKHCNCFFLAIVCF